jgi:hypothetical protein
MRQHCLSTCLFTSYARIELSSSPGRRPLFHLGPSAGPLNPSPLPPADKRTPTVRPSPTSDPHHAVPRSLGRTRPGRTIPCRSALVCYLCQVPHPACSAPRLRRCGASPSSTHGYTHSCTTVRVVSHSCACAAACPYATPHFSRTMLPFPFPSPSIHQ